jgi:hypothetical protein
VQVAEDVSREWEVTSSNPADRVAANFARKMPRLATSTETGGRWPVGPSPDWKIFFQVFFAFFYFALCRASGSRQRLCQVPDKRLSAKKPLPIGFLPRALCRELRSAKALLRALEALPRAWGPRQSSRLRSWMAKIDACLYLLKKCSWPYQLGLVQI